MNIFRLDDVFDLESSSLSFQLCLYISFTAFGNCSFILLETISNKVLIIGDKAGAQKIDFSKGIEDDWFKHFDDYDIEQQFKRYECST
jgi:hypothetical protein